MASKDSFGRRRYAMKLHQATRLHFDLRLELNGVLLSWALPADLSLCAGVDYEAVEMEDHRLANITFEGKHETGTIMLWDRGAWEPLTEFEDVARCLSGGLLRFVLYGERLGGIWTLCKLRRMQGGRPLWILRKEVDAFAVDIADLNVLDRWPNSISTGRPLEEILRDWIHPQRKHGRQSGLFE